MKKLFLLLLLAISAPAFADDLSNGSWNTTDASNNAAPPNGWPAGMFPNQVEPTARSNMGGLKRWWERANPTLSTSGSAGAYVITTSNTAYPTAYTQGEVICGKANFTSIGNDTLAVNSLAAKPIYMQGASSIINIAASTLLIGAQFCAGYDGALNSAAGGWQLLTLALPSAASFSGFFLQKSNNLSDLPSASTARTNLGINNGGTTTITASHSGPSGSANNGDLWVQY